jgi:adenosylcobinamide-GDP ribazoletransferase
LADAQRSHGLLPTANAHLAEALTLLRTAAGFLTRLPLAGSSSPAGNFLSRATVAFPVVGAGIGGVGGLVCLIAVAVGLPAPVGALAAIAAMVALTGALHEDGLADFCDGIGGGRDRFERLRIMRDSHNGTFATLALVLSVGLRAALITAVTHGGSVLAALISAGAISRAGLPVVMVLVAPARTDGLAAAAGRPTNEQVALTVALAGGIAWLASGLGAALLMVFSAGLAVGAIALLARRALGGQTGDVLGACQQVSEVAVLAVAAAMAVP